MSLEQQQSRDVDTRNSSWCMGVSSLPRERHECHATHTCHDDPGNDRVGAVRARAARAFRRS